MRRGSSFLAAMNSSKFRLGHGVLGVLGGAQPTGAPGPAQGRVQRPATPGDRPKWDAARLTGACRRSDKGVSPGGVAPSPKSAAAVSPAAPGHPHGPRLGRVPAALARLEEVDHAPAPCRLHRLRRPHAHRRLPRLALRRPRARPRRHRHPGGARPGAARARDRRGSVHGQRALGRHRPGAGAPGAHLRRHPRHRPRHHGRQGVRLGHAGRHLRREDHRRSATPTSSSPAAWSRCRTCRTTSRRRAPATAWATARSSTG